MQTYTGAIMQRLLGDPAGGKRVTWRTERDDRTLLVLRVTDHTSSDFSKLPIIY